MKHVILWRENNPQKRFEPVNSEICNSEEAVAATLQSLQINPETMRRYVTPLEIRVTPYFEVGQMVLNLRTLQTRIVRYADHLNGILGVYNTDLPYEANLQKKGNTPILPETWSMDNCIPIDLCTLLKDHTFQLGTEMGTNPNYAKVSSRET